ncbi:MAG: hypothetical protein ACOZNI_00895 [Myxococcota bacterium]
MLASVLLAAHAFAADSCRWRGEAVDPFTRKDGRYLETSMPLGSRSGSGVGLVVHHAAGGFVQVDLGFSEDGATNRKVDATIQFLLDDGAVVAVHVVEHALPTSKVSQMSRGLYTTHLASGSLSAEDAGRLGAASRITRVRHDLLPGGVVTHSLDPLDSRALVRAFACATDP